MGVLIRTHSDAYTQTHTYTHSPVYVWFIWVNLYMWELSLTYGHNHTQLVLCEGDFFIVVLVIYGTKSLYTYTYTHTHTHRDTPRHTAARKHCKTHGRNDMHAFHAQACTSALIVSIVNCTSLVGRDEVRTIYDECNEAYKQNFNNEVPHKANTNE